ncbi:MAG: hypothetical protein PWQ22_841 [Archaeoglobaceae archaeon]|nr:hypothetical protein [Archaeoglobaceae archaeon]
MSYVSGSTSGLFDFMETITSGADYVKFLGVDTDGVNVATKTEVAKARFSVSSSASNGSVITFNVVTANVDGVNVRPTVGTVTVVTAPPTTPPPTTPPPTTPPTTPPPTTPPPTTPTTPALNKGPIDNTALAITSMKLSDTNYTYGGNVELTVTWGYYKAETYGTRYIAIIDWSTYTSKVKTSSGFSVAKASDPSNYKWFIALPEDGGSQTYSINTAEKEMSPSYYVVVVFNGAGTYDDRLVFIVEPVAGKPYVSISVVSGMTAALGDRVEIKYKMTASEPYYVGVLVTGWEGKTYFANCAAGTWTQSPWMAQKTSFDRDICGIKFFDLTSAYGFKDTTEGYIEFKIAAGKDPNNLFSGTDPTRAEATAVVILAKPTLSSISVPSKHVNGTDITITGVTNVAETGSKYDIGLQNIVTLNITDLNDNLKCTASGLVAKDKTFTIKIDNFGAKAPCGPLETGYYKAKFKLVTDTNFTDEETTVFELVNGMVKIQPDKTTVVRGDKVKFTIVTNLKVNNPVYFTIKDARIIGGSGEDTKTLYVDATGKAYYEI